MGGDGNGRALLQVRQEESWFVTGISEEFRFGGENKQILGEGKTEVVGPLDEKVVLGNESKLIMGLGLEFRLGPLLFMESSEKQELVPVVEALILATSIRLAVARMTRVPRNRRSPRCTRRTWPWSWRRKA